MHCSIKRFNLTSQIGDVNIQWFKEILCLFLLSSLFMPAYSASNTVPEDKINVSTASSNTNSTIEVPRNTIIVLGDSISAAYGIPTESGWVKLLEKRLLLESKHYTIINASISGETTEGGVKRLPNIIDRHSPSILLIELGGNDGLRGFPLKLIESNLQTLVDQAKANGITPILVAMRIPPNYGRRYTEGFYELFVKTAEKNNILMVPFLLEEVALNPEMMQADGIHPTALAQPLLLERIWETLAPELN